MKRRGDRHKAQNKIRFWSQNCDNEIQFRCVSLTLLGPVFLLPLSVSDTLSSCCPIHTPVTYLLIKLLYKMTSRIHKRWYFIYLIYILRLRIQYSNFLQGFHNWFQSQSKPPDKNTACFFFLLCLMFVQLLWRDLVVGLIFVSINW